MKSAEMEGQTLRVQQLGDNYIMIDLKGITPDTVDAIVQLEVVK